MQPRFIIENLEKLVSQLPVTSLHLVSEKTGEKKFFPALAISDHNVYFAMNKHGIIGNFNMLNPESPVTQCFIPGGMEGPCVIANEEERLNHIKEVACYIVKLFAAGLDAIALQEVPVPPKENEKSYFTDLVRELAKAAEENKVNLDLQAFKDNYRQTRKPSNSKDFHKFGTAILFNPNVISINNICTFAHDNGRGATYLLHSKKSNQDFCLVNFHGAYNESRGVIEFIKSNLKPGTSKEPIINTIVVGDTNISLDKKEIIAEFQELNGVTADPRTNVPGAKSEERTLDCCLTNFPSDFSKLQGQNFSNLLYPLNQPSISKTRLGLYSQNTTQVNNDQNPEYFVEARKTF